jgi:hypothetical protein
MTCKQYLKSTVYRAARFTVVMSDSDVEALCLEINAGPRRHDAERVLQRRSDDHQPAQQRATHGQPWRLDRQDAGRLT